MSGPLLVSISGIEGMGVGVACERIALTLNKFSVNTVVVNLVTPKRTREFEDNWVLGKYNRMDVVIVMRHGFTHSAVKMRLTDAHSLWQPDSIHPAFAVLLTCAEDTYAQRNNIPLTLNMRTLDKDKRLLRRANYERLSSHWGTTRLYKLDVGGANGRLIAAGKILRLIRKELGYAVDDIA